MRADHTSAPTEWLPGRLIPTQICAFLTSREVMRFKPSAYRTEQAYRSWSGRSAVVRHKLRIAQLTYDAAAASNVMREERLSSGLRACSDHATGYVLEMALTNIAVAEEALSLSPADRADLAKLLIESLEGDGQTDENIKAEVAHRLEQLRTDADSGLTFQEVFKSPL